MTTYSSITLSHNASIYIAYFSQNSLLLTNSEVLTTKEAKHYGELKNGKRKEEFLLVRWLAKEVLSSTILYKESGSPYLSNNDEISISHCADAVVIMVSNSPCGVDVENINRNFKKVAKRIVTPNDRPITEDGHLAEYWCTKEAIYKAFDGDINDILSDIVIEDVIGAQIHARVDHMAIIANIIYVDSLIISYTIIN